MVATDKRGAEAPTPKQAVYIGVIVSLMGGGKPSPTIDEIANARGVTKGSAQGMLRTLEESGFVESAKGKFRSIRLSEKTLRFLGGGKEIRRVL